MRKHALTLTSSPSVWRQSSLNLGNTCSPRALRSAALSAQRIESNFSTFRQETFAVWAQGTKLISEYNRPFAYPLGWSTDRFSRRMIWRWVSSAPLWSAWQRMKATVKTGKIKTDGGGEKNEHKHIQQGKHSSFSSVLLVLFPPALLRKFSPHMFTELLLSDTPTLPNF